MAVRVTTAQNNRNVDNHSFEFFGRDVQPTSELTGRRETIHPPSSLYFALPPLAFNDFLCSVRVERDGFVPAPYDPIAFWRWRWFLTQSFQSNSDERRGR